MSLVSTPEQTRTKATRSRCLGFMFAWILNTKPLKSARSGSIGEPSSASRTCGHGAYCTSASRNDSSPKLVSALPKNTGVWRASQVRVEIEARAGGLEQVHAFEQFVACACSPMSSIRCGIVGAGDRDRARGARCAATRS